MGTTNYTVAGGMGNLQGCNRQSTLACTVTLSGTGVHTGRPSRVTLRPAETDSGIRFRRTDLTNGTRSTVIKVDRHNVGSTRLCTELRNEDGVSVMTVEHLLAALGGVGIDNAEVHVSGPEVPILDGSSLEFLAAIEDAGVRQQDRTRGYIRIVEPISLQIGSASAAFEPADDCVIEAWIDFPHAAIGQQKFTYTASSDAFRRDVAPARTFGFLAQATELRAAGYGLGASLDNTVVLDDRGVMNRSGLRFADEFVRHKTLDACGDLLFAGAPIIGRFQTARGGHQLNHAALNCLLSRPTAWEYVAAGERENATFTPEHPLAVDATIGLAG